MKLKSILSEVLEKYQSVEKQPIRAQNKTGLRVRYDSPTTIGWPSGLPKPGQDIYVYSRDDWYNPKKVRIDTYGPRGYGTFEEDGVEYSFKLKVQRNTEGYIEIIWFELLEN